MRFILLALVFLCSCRYYQVTTPTNNELGHQDPLRLQTEMLAPAVMLTWGDGCYGSGTIVGCEALTFLGYHIYILTAAHVVNHDEDATLRVQTFSFAFDTYSYQESATATIEWSDQRDDVALVSFYSPHTYPTAKMLPHDVIVPLGCRVYGVGCGYTKVPHIAIGYLSCSENSPYYEKSIALMPMFFGNSGGALYVEHLGVFYYAGITNWIGMYPDPEEGLYKPVGNISMFRNIRAIRRTTTSTPAARFVQ